MKSSFICLHLFSVFLFTNISYGQQSVSSATVRGQAQDPSGAVVNRLTVTMFNQDRSQRTAVETDDKGRYQFLSLSPGNYELQVSDPRFSEIRKQVTLSAGQALDIPIELAVAAQRESAVVVETVAPLETVRTQISYQVTPREINSLPLNGRNYLDLALLVPSVSRTNTGASQRFAETSAVPGTGISVSSQRNLNNSFLVDGVSSNDDAANLSGSFLSQEVIREFQVISSGGFAEFGRASSGVISIVTKSGTNDFHGRAYGFFRNQRFDARNAFADRRYPLTQSQYGASLGGRIIPNRTFFFSNFEQMRQHTAGLITLAPSNATAINQVLDAIGYHGERVTTGEFPGGYHTTNYFIRLDHRINEANQLQARYNIYDIYGWNARTVGSLNAVSRGSNLENRDQTIAISETATLSPRLLNEARFQYTRSRLGAPVNDEVGPAVNINGVANFGTATFSPQRRDTDLFQFSDALSTYRGEHFLKAGADVLYNRVNILFPGAVQGVYTFQNLAAFQAHRYINYQQAFGAPNQFQSNPNVGFFLQDEWRIHPAVTIHAGVRYDLQFLPSPIETDTNNIAPRFGIAWAPGDRKTVIRASYGLFYDHIPLRATSNSLQRDGSKYQVAVLSFGQDGAPVFPNVLGGFPAGQYISVTTIDPRIENSYTHQASLQIERQLGANTQVSVGYQYLRGLHLILSRNQNVPTLTAVEAAALGVANLGRPDPRYGNVSRYESSGDSYYNGLIFSLHHRMSKWFHARVSYNYSKTIDTIGNFFFSSPQNNANLRDDRGRSDNDQRHRLTVAGVFWSGDPTGSWQKRILNGWEFSPLFLYTSSLPFNVQLNWDRNFDTNLNDRPVGLGRNTGFGFDYASLDLRLSRTFHLTEHWRIEGLFESFNTLNRVNRQLPNNIIGNGIGAPLPTFGRATAAGDPRQLQLGLRVSF